MNTHWFASPGAIRPELVNEEAEKIARSMVREFKNRQGESRPDGVKSSQLRRLYGEVKSLERRVASGQEWATVKPMVKLLRAKTAYNTGRAVSRDRNSGNEYRALERFVNDSVAKIEEKAEFLAFCKQFEAVVGFYYGITNGGLKDRRG